MKNEMTFTQAFDYQLKDIEFWSRILNTDSYLRLLTKVIEINGKGYDNPYQVVRGSGLSSIVQNL
jgi:hypothetical protein